MYEITGEGRVPLTSATYVDPACEGRSWERVESSSKQYIWGENCPVYIELTFGRSFMGDAIEEGLLFNILKESYRILRPGGSAIFPILPEKVNEEIIEQLQEHPIIQARWKISVERTSSFPIRLAPGDRELKKALIVFTKRTGPNRNRRNNKDNSSRKSNKRNSKHSSKRGGNRKGSRSTARCNS
jgi:hypothetical protein